jgi:hypothetical protein
VGAMAEDGTAAGGRLKRSGKRVLAVVAVGWAVVLGLILRQSLFVSHDSLSNYSHVWWVGEQLRAGQGLTFRMPVLGHGDALTFPYGFLPWVTAGLLWLAFGDWAVTLWIVVGFIGLVVAMFWAVPEIRSGWWAAAALLNPTLVMAPIIGQLPFIWATAFFFVAVGCWRRDKRVLAVLAATIAQGTHPAVLMPIALVVVAAWLPWEKQRRKLLLGYLVSVVLALPAAWFVFDSPVITDTSFATQVANFFETVAVRLFVVAVPLVLAAIRNRGASWLPGPVLRRGLDLVAAAVVGVAIVLNLVWLGPFQMAWAWGSLSRKPDTQMKTFTKSEMFTPGLTYRILRAGDGKIGMYQVLRAGGRLDSEFFPESIDRRSFAGESVYSTFLRKRGVDVVILFTNYDRRWKTNEHVLLDDLAAGPGCSATAVGVTHELSTARYDVYRIQRDCSIAIG